MSQAVDPEDFIVIEESDDENKKEIIFVKGIDDENNTSTKTKTSKVDDTTSKIDNTTSKTDDNTAETNDKTAKTDDKMPVRKNELRPGKLLEEINRRKRKKEAE